MEYLGAPHVQVAPLIFIYLFIFIPEKVEMIAPGNFCLLPQFHEALDA